MQESRTITRKSASNLALAFVLLPRAKRDGMSALYAFCREVNDVADNEGLPVEQRREQLAVWRADIRRACAGEAPRFQVNRELQPIIRDCQLPLDLFEELLRGVEMDLDINRYQTFADLDRYCYRVASVVGLLSIEVFGYQDPACRPYAVHLGRALQLTNILRDVRVDAERGRIYLPWPSWRVAALPPRKSCARTAPPGFFEAAQATAQRARDFYRQARETLPVVDRRSMIAAELMGSVYWRLLRKVEARRFNVFRPQASSPRQRGEITSHPANLVPAGCRRGDAQLWT